MGTKARELFEQAYAVGGIRGKIRLATLARMTSTEADTIQESPELIERLQRSLSLVRAEFGKPSNIDVDELTGGKGERVADGLRVQLATVLEMISQRNLFLGDAKTTFCRITEAAAGVLGLARVSVWLVDRGVTKIVCADLFERANSLHSSGLELNARDYGPYFTALREQRTIAAHDAHTDPRTSCFSAGYLTPLGIASMLDVPIWVNQELSSRSGSRPEMAGVICHEHIGSPRTWNGDDENFAYIMANLAALALERRKL